MQAQERSKWQQAAQVLTNEESKNLHEARKLLHGACTHQSNQASEGQKTMRQQKKRIAIFQSDLHVGGIQKSLVNLMSLEAMDKYDVDVYLFDRMYFLIFRIFGRIFKFITSRRFRIISASFRLARL